MVTVDKVPQFRGRTKSARVLCIIRLLKIAYGFNNYVSYSNILKQLIIENICKAIILWLKMRILHLWHRKSINSGTTSCLFGYIVMGRAELLLHCPDLSFSLLDDLEPLSPEPQGGQVGLKIITRIKHYGDYFYLGVYS